MPTTKTAKENSMVTVGYSALGVSLPLFVAHRAGLFADQGLRVQMRGYPTAHPLVEGIIDEDVPCGGFVAFPIALHRHLRARPLHYACAVAEDLDNPISFLLVRRGSGIRSIDDLAGRRVGVLPTKAYREWLKALLARSGLGYHQVKLDRTCKCMQTCSASKVPIERMVPVHDVLPHETAMALRSGRVDAIFTNDPGATAAVRSGVAEVFGDRPILPSLLGSPFLFGSFVFDSDFVADRPDEARRIVAALDAGVRFCRHDPAEARRLAAPYLPPSCSDLSDGLGRPIFLTSGEVDTARLQATIDLLADGDMIGGPVQIGPWVMRTDAPSLPRSVARPPRSARADHAGPVAGCA
jgi:ABC-type nitrate/sulfonate/bicarbonate transport system substrate-binding protein